MTDDQMPAQSRPATDWYMMATKAVHQLGDISRDEADLAVIYGADGDHYVGEWATGMGYVNVRFPKETTRELTDAEKAYYATKVLDVAGMVRAIRPLSFAPKDRQDPASAADLSAGLALQAALGGPSAVTAATERPAEGTERASGGVVSAGPLAAVGDQGCTLPPIRMRKESLNDFLAEDYVALPRSVLDGLRAERDELRAKVAAVRAWLNAEDLRISDWGKTHNPECECETEYVTHYVIGEIRKLLGGEA